MSKLIAVLSWMSVAAIMVISLIFCLLESWLGVVVSLALVPAIGIALMASEDANF